VRSFKLVCPNFRDHFILRSGAHRLIEQAVEAERSVLLAAHADDKTEDGRSRVVRHGYLPGREVMTGIGPVPVKEPRGFPSRTGSSNFKPPPDHAITNFRA